MRLFISYARIDKPYCIQIVQLLDIHDVWYDQRLYAGLNWWNEILRRLEWCEGFIYLLSPESVKSEYCRREYDLACSLGRHIFPVLIQSETPIPSGLHDIQYADLSQGLLAESVKVLLNAVHLAEVRQRQNEAARTALFGPKNISAPGMEPSAVIGAAAHAMEKGEYDQAVFLLRQAKENGYTSRFINIESLLAEAEAALNHQSQLREIERDYKQIAALIDHKVTARLGCEAFEAFHREIKDYDPDNLAAKCAAWTAASLAEKKTQIPTPIISKELPLLKWCQVPAGEVVFRYTDTQKNAKRVTVQLDEFNISKYPITNAQYDVFINSPQGYSNSEWWSFSDDAYQWFRANASPKPPKFQGEDRPREMLNWYEAVAFCGWLSDRIDHPVTLPSIFEWQRAFQGDDQRLFPWGNTFDVALCNTIESQLKMTSLVTRYPESASPFAVHDLAGNVWEWCLNLDFANNFSPDLQKLGKRIVRGGSFMSPGLRANANFYYSLKPDTFHAAIGFRVVYKS